MEFDSMTDIQGLRAWCLGGLGCGWLTMVIAAGFATGVMIALLAIPVAAFGWLIVTIALLLPRDPDQPMMLRLAGAALVVVASLLLVVSLVSELNQVTHMLIAAQRQPPLVWAWSRADAVALLASLGAGALAGTGLALRTNWHAAWAVAVGLLLMLTTPCAAGVMLLAAASGLLPLTA
jgi:hypothetical protein